MNKNKNVFMDAIKDIHRNCLKQVNPIINKEDWNKSNDQYGLPPHAYPLINLPIDNNLTYADLLAYLSNKYLKKNIKYVEIGVSVLKTFFQMCNSLKNSDLYAFDINQINPVVEKKFEKLDEHDNIKTYNYETNKLHYFKGDIFNHKQLNDFEKYLSGKVNVIFSDAHHSGEGLKSEYDNLIQNILAEEYILYYDDLENVNMRKVFFEIGKKEKNKNKKVQIALIKINSWLGNHQHQHLNGVITTLDLKKIFQSDNILIPVQWF